MKSIGYPIIQPHQIPGNLPGVKPIKNIIWKYIGHKWPIPTKTADIITTAKVRYWRYPRHVDNHAAIPWTWSSSKRSRLFTANLTETTGGNTSAQAAPWGDFVKLSLWLVLEEYIMPSQNAQQPWEMTPVPSMKYSFIYGHWAIRLYTAPHCDPTLSARFGRHA